MIKPSLSPVSEVSRIWLPKDCKTLIPNFPNKKEWYNEKVLQDLGKLNYKISIIEDIKYKEYPLMKHEILMEEDKKDVLKDIIDFYNE